MSDPLDELRNLIHQGIDVTPLPAPEVRRRGDRLRRRQQALAAVGGVAAIALIATPIAVLANGNDHASPPITGPSRTEWVTTIPTGFPLATGYPDTNADLTPVEILNSDAKGLNDYTSFCGGQAFPTTKPLDLASVEFTGENDYRSRSLAVYPSDVAAKAALDHVRSAVAACPVDKAGGGRNSLVDLAPVTDGDALAVVKAYTSSDSAVESTVSVNEVVRVGNAVIIAFGLGFDSETDPAAKAAKLAQATAPVVDQMCVFASGGCGTSTPSDPTTSVTQPAVQEIPEDYPLLEGWPDDSQAESDNFGLDGPSRSMALMELTACGQTLAYPAYVDRLNASWSNPEDYRDRQLMTFADADQAVAFVDQFAQHFRDCPVEPVGSDGYTPHHLVIDTATGGQSVAVASYYEYDGAPAVGLQLLHAVRLGRAVLLISEYGEGGAGPADEREAIFRQSIGRMTDDAAAPIAAMCAFTEAGCSGTTALEDVLGPNGYGPLQLGMTADQADATNGLALANSDGPCQLFTLAGFPSIADHTDGYLTAANGLESIFARPGMRTPQGISIGSTRAELLTAYAHLVGGDAYLAAPASDTARYEFGLDGDKVVSVALALVNQSCYR